MWMLFAGYYMIGFLLPVICRYIQSTPSQCTLIHGYIKSTPWGHVLSLKTFCQIPALSWAISNSVFQPVKFTSTLQKLLATFFQTFDIWWSSLDIMDDFKLISRTVIFRLGEINNIMIFSFVKKNFFFTFFSSLLHIEL